MNDDTEPMAIDVGHKFISTFMMQSNSHKIIGGECIIGVTYFENLVELATGEILKAKHIYGVIKLVVGVLLP